MTHPRSLFGLLLLVGVTLECAAQPPAPQWIWSAGSRQVGSEVEFSTSIEVQGDVRSAKCLVLSEYCHTWVKLNGETIGRAAIHDDPLEVDLATTLRPGANTVTVGAVAGKGPAAIGIRIVLQDARGDHRFDSDPSWQSRTAPVVSYGRVATRPWLVSPRVIEINPFDDYTQWKRAVGGAPDREPERFHTLPEFEVRLIRAAAPEEGSWVSLAVDAEGRFVIAREDKGLLRMTLDDNGDAIAKVETINDELLECRGLVFAHDSLYANANNSKGLYRLRDTDGDGQFESVDLLYRSTGGVGHGRNDLALGPDGWIYSIHGDSVDLPTKLPDLTSPFREQRRGAATREGHVMRLNADGSKIELVTAGLRNPFGIDFNADGEMFTYDADAEHDMGSPWYRPTRVNHLIPGGDYGWRGVTGSWPPYYPDHPAAALPTLDIGKGSPTAVKFGHRSNFPPPYRDALYILDWAYGRVLAVHLVPRGAGYFGRAEPFLRGRPLNVTDLDFGPAGDMYLVTGGRKTQSGLYRIRFTGRQRPAAEVTAQQAARAKFTSAARQRRRELEALLTPSGAAAVDLAWPQLSSDDPRLVQAAQLAIEHQPFVSWRARALDEPSPRAAIPALLSLARSGQTNVKAAIVDRLNALDLGKLSRRKLLAAAYTYQVCLTDDANLSATQTRGAIDKLEALYPQSDFDTDRIIGELLVSHAASSVVAKTLAQRTAVNRQRDQMQCLHVLRNARQGWEPRWRQAYFSALRQSDDYLGGQGMPGFIEKIRADAIATLSDAEKQQLGELIQARPSTEEEAPGPPRTFVRKWKLADLVEDLGGNFQSRNLARGKQLFTAALCARCHRLGTLGRSVGPDLTSVAQRFSERDLLKEILEPSATVAENYLRHEITTKSGKVYQGQVIYSGDYRSPVLKMATDPLAPTRLTEILKSDIETSQPSARSFMPNELLDTLERDEVFDLLAFLRSGGVTTTAVKP